MGSRRQRWENGRKVGSVPAFYVPPWAFRSASVGSGVLGRGREENGQASGKGGADPRRRGRERAEGKTGTEREERHGEEEEEEGPAQSASGP